MIGRWWKPVALAVVVSAVLIYAMMAPALGPDPRTWSAQIEAMQIEAVRAEWDRVCRRPRP